MKIALMSDMHLEFGNAFADYDIPDCDVLVLAGDIGVGRLGIDWAASYIQGKIPVVYVAGNHEFYGRDLDETMEFLRKYAAMQKNIHFLDNNEVIIDGQHFIGATLWTDFNLYGQWERSAHVAFHGMSDFRVIRGMNIRIWREMYERSLKYINDHVNQHSIVVTHYCPHENSIAARWRGDSLTPAFTSHTYNSLAIKPKLWLHGHTHDSHDYMVDETRIVCNPFGYLRQEVNPDFTRMKIIETD